jgi:hypothetical protein
MIFCAPCAFLWPIRHYFSLFRRRDASRNPSKRKPNNDQLWARVKQIITNFLITICQRSESPIFIIKCVNTLITHNLFIKCPWFSAPLL